MTGFPRPGKRRMSGGRAGLLLVGAVLLLWLVAWPAAAQFNIGGTKQDKNAPTAPPAWQMRAREISDDKELKLIEFRDAVMEIDGWPVFYTPYMSQPEPSVKRASGFLMPSFGNSNTVGFHASVPYYWVIGPDNDLTLAPR